MTAPGDERVNDPVETPTTDGSDESTGDTEQSAGGMGTAATRDAPRGERRDERRNERQGERWNERRGERQDGPPHHGTNGGQDEGDDAGWVLFARDLAASLGAVALIGFYLFAISGVWPPMVAIESGSMEPNMDVNDLVFVMDADRFQPDDAQGDTGVVTAHTGAETGYAQFGDSGDVIVFAPDGNTEATPIIHRAMFWVEEGENWCERADPEHLGNLDPSNDRCEAPHDGFITRGDRNQVYDQVQMNTPVKPEWVVGTAEVRVPGLGWFRLQFQ